MGSADPTGPDHQADDLFGRWLAHREQSSTDEPSAERHDDAPRESAARPARPMSATATPAATMLGSARVAPPSNFGARRTLADEREPSVQFDFEPVVIRSMRRKADEPIKPPAPKGGPLARLRARTFGPVPGEEEHAGDVAPDPTVEPLAPTALHATPGSPTAPVSPPVEAAPPAPPADLEALIARATASAATAEPTHLAAPVAEPPAPPRRVEPVAVRPEPQPEPVAVQPEPDPEPDPEPVAVAVEPEPVAVTPEPEPVAMIPEPEPVAVVHAPMPAPEPVAYVPEPIDLEPIDLALVEEPLPGPAVEDPEPTRSTRSRFARAPKAPKAPRARKAPKAPRTREPAVAAEPRRRTPVAPDRPSLRGDVGRDLTSRPRPKAAPPAPTPAEPVPAPAAAVAAPAARAATTYAALATDADASQMPGVYEFRPVRSSRRVLTVALLAGLAATAYFGWQAYQSQTTAAEGLVAIVALGTATVWAIRAGAAPTRMTIKQGQLEVRRQGGRFVFDLASVYTPIEVHGRAGRPGWRVTFLRRGMPPFAIDRTMVDPHDFMRVLAFFRPGLGE